MPRVIYIGGMLVVRNLDQVRATTIQVRVGPLLSALKKLEECRGKDLKAPKKRKENIQRFQADERAKLNIRNSKFEEKQRERKLLQDIVNGNYEKKK
jgi:hypothetical protein